VILRAATVDDAGGVALLERQLFAGEAWPLSSVVAEIASAGRIVLVAVVDGEVVGYSVGMVAGEVVDLLRIGVAPSAQRRGLARSLLAALVDRATSAGAQRMLLEVSEENRPALALYAAEGFTEVDRRPRYYRDGSTALVLQRRLLRE